MIMFILMRMHMRFKIFSIEIYTKKVIRKEIEGIWQEDVVEKMTKNNVYRKWYAHRIAPGILLICLLVGGTNALMDDVEGSLRYYEDTQGSISGYEINDLNDNGMHDAGENGLSNWNIELKGIEIDTIGVKKETITDEAGFYTFDNLPAGKYLVSEKFKKDYTPTGSPVRFIHLIQGQKSRNNNFTNRLIILSNEDIKILYNGKKALNHIEQLVNIGPRVAGGDAEKKAAKYISGKMISYGLDVTTQKFPMLYFEDKGSTLNVVNGHSLNPNTLFYSPSGEITAQIADCGLGYPENFTTCGASGKIALIQRGEIFFWQKVQNAANASALAAIIYNNLQGNFTGTLTFVTDIPAVGVNESEGKYLAELLKRKTVTVNIKVDTITENRTSQNVIGTMKGKDPEQGIVYIGGHYDSVSAGPGANDDASGVGAMLEAARLLSNYRTKATINFIAFGSEETGLDGSYNYIEKNRKEVSTKGIGMINLDMIGVGNTTLIGNLDNKSSNLTNYTRKKASVMNLSWKPFTAEANSDHTYFEEAGVPAVFIYQSEDPWYHTSNDTIEKINKVKLEKNGELATATIYGWANNPQQRAKSGMLSGASLKKANVHYDILFSDN
jgi:aminopeptidase YwaD